MKIKPVLQRVMMSFAAITLVHQTLIRRIIVIMGLVVLLVHFLSLNQSLQYQVTYVFAAIFIMLLMMQIMASFFIPALFVSVVGEYISYLADLVHRVADSTLTAPVIDFSYDHLLRQQSQWIFLPGFSPGLRVGFRSYLLQIERAVELLHHLEQSVNCIKYDNELYDCFVSSMTVNKALLCLLRTFFDGQPLSPDDTADWMHDLQLLEQLLEKRCPSLSQAAHLNSRDLQLIDLIVAAKDLRQVLLQLVMALPEKLK